MSTWRGIFGFACIVLLAVILGLVLQNLPLVPRFLDPVFKGLDAHLKAPRSPAVTLHPDYVAGEIPFHGRPTCVRFSPDGAYLAIGTSGADFDALNGWLIIIETATGKTLHKDQLKERVHWIEFTADGTSLLVVISTRDHLSNPPPFVRIQGEAHLFDFPSMKKTHVWKHERLAWRGSFHPDGKRYLVYLERNDAEPNEILLIDPSDGSSTRLATRISSEFVVRKEHDDVVCAGEDSGRRILMVADTEPVKMRLSGIEWGFTPLRSTSDGKIAIVDNHEVAVFDWKTKSRVYDCTWIPRDERPYRRTWFSADLSRAIAALPTPRRQINHPADKLVRIDFKANRLETLLSTTDEMELICGDFASNGLIAVGVSKFKGLHENSPSWYGHVVMLRKK